MLIDWFTVSAQALNFVLLVWLLKRFLYRPVLDAIDARESRIARQIADARDSESAARTACDAYTLKSEAFDRERAALLNQATLAADAERARLLEEAGKSAAALSARQRDAWREEAVQMSRDLGERARREVFAIARQVLTELADTDLEARMTDVFIHRLSTLDAPAEALLASSLKCSGGQAVLRSAFEMPSAQRQALKAAIVDRHGAAIELRFETAADLVSGIELVAGGQKLSWTIAHHLSALEQLVTTLVQSPPPEPQADQTMPSAT